MQEKTALLGAIAGRNRGLLAGEIDRANLLSAIAGLEAVNPNPEPLEGSDLLDGDWRLLYTTSQDLLGFDRFPLLQTGTIYQSIRSDRRRVFNVAELLGPPLLEGIFTVLASFEASSSNRADVRFERAVTGLQRAMGYRSPGDLLERLERGERFWPLDFDLRDRDRRGWLETTYLDEDLRIGRGDKGSVFVLRKE